MDKYKSNENIRAAIIRAATDAGSFKLLAATANIESVTLQLLADGHISEINSNTLKALAPYIICNLPGNEKKSVVNFLAVTPLRQEATPGVKGACNG